MQRTVNIRAKPATVVTHEQLVLEHLRTVGAITPGEAWDRWRCMRLGARIYDLRAKNHCIEQRMIVLPSGKRVAQYRLVSESPSTAN